MPKSIRMRGQEMKLLLPGDKFLNPYQHDRQEWTFVRESIEEGWFKVLDANDNEQLVEGTVRVDVVSLKKEVPTPFMFGKASVLAVFRYRTAIAAGNNMMKYSKQDAEGVHKRLAGGMLDNHQTIVCRLAHEIWYLTFHDGYCTIGDEIEIGNY